MLIDLRVKHMSRCYDDVNADEITMSKSVAETRMNEYMRARAAQHGARGLKRPET